MNSTLQDELIAEVNISVANENGSDCFTHPLEAVSKDIQPVLIALFILIAIIAFLGNLAVVLVETLGRNKSKSLRKFLINMAASDMIMAVLCVPYTHTSVMLGRWVFQPWLCPAAVFTQLLSVSVTSFTLTVIGVERYLATIHPFSKSYRWIKSHTKIILYASWIISISYSLIWLPHSKTVPFSYQNQTYQQCKTSGFLGWQKKVVMTYNFVFTYALPFVVIAFSYAAISRKLIKDSMSDSDAPLRRNVQNTKSKAKTIKMMFAIVILYGICWTPIKMYQLAQEYTPSIFDYCSQSGFYKVIIFYFFAHTLAMSNSFVNPVVYSFMSKNFMENFRSLFDRNNSQTIRYRTSQRTTRTTCENQTSTL